ncbi:hypothetical protein HOY82DRAFT_82199 [Tuber indicum]|nr:hypothetical protein HOY82DRAFT_82199 [Tuber indicum]
MSNKLDPHHLVALMSHVFDGARDGSSRRMDPSLFSFEHGIVDHHATNVRTFPILDAIASISVSQKQHQVIAVALQLDNKKKEIRLTIADNKQVSWTLLKHLRKLWKNLQTLSDNYAWRRNGGSDNPEYPLEPPDIPVQVAHILKVQIFRDIYLYSIRKQIRRIEKWFQKLGEFMTVLLDTRGYPNLQGFEVNLFNGVTSLLVALELVAKLRDNPGSQLTDQEWAEVYRQSLMANEDVRVVLAAEHGVGCEVLAKELKDDDDPDDPFDLRRALAKLTSLTQHIECLFGFAHSPRLRPALLCRAFIVGVPMRSRHVRLPPSPSAWKHFLETACQQSHKWQEGDAVELAKKFKLPKYFCAVHCECKLIHHLQTTRQFQWGGIPPFSYIGVSKLSCSACRIWVEAFNKLGGRKFYTRGSHGKWYWPWGMPQMGEPLDTIMATKILEEYIAHERANERLSSQSDSSGASPRGALHRLSDDQREEAADHKSALQQQFGGDMLLLYKSKFPKGKKKKVLRRD